MQSATLLSAGKVETVQRSYWYWYRRVSGPAFIASEFFVTRVLGPMHSQCLKVGLEVLGALTEAPGSGVYVAVSRVRRQEA